MINTVQAIIRLADPRGQEVFDLLRAKFKDQSGAAQIISSLEAEFRTALKK
jgi:hypothetical protein